MTGNFAKQDAEFMLTNLVVQTTVGAFRAEGFSEGPAFRLQKIEWLSTNPHNAMDKNTADQLKKLVH